MSFKSIELGVKQEFVLKSLEIGLSSNCNFKCDYCCAYNLNDRNFLAGERVIEIVKSAPDLQRVKLSGGEVLIYFDECVKVVEYCKERGIKTQINTNGSLLSREKIGVLEAAGLDCLHFSFNFADRRRFAEYYRQREEVFDRIERNISLAAQSGIDTVVETVMFKRTEHALVEIHNYVYELGVRMHEIQNGIPIAKNDWAEVLPRERLHEMIEELVDNKRPDAELYFSCIDIEPGSAFHQKVLGFLARGQLHFPSCIEGRNQLHLHSNGDVLICELGHPTVIGNLNDGTRLSTILREKPRELVEFLERRSTQGCACVIRTLAQPAQPIQITARG